MLVRLESILLALGALAVVLLGVLIAGNVVARSVFGTSIPDSVIIVQELMVAAILLPLAATTASRTHICVEFISDKFGARVKSWLIVMGTVIGMLALIPLIYAGWRELVSNWSSGSFYFGDLALPKWPGKLIFILGFGACWLRLLELAIRDTRTILAGGIVDDQHELGEIE
ncbi:TRAP transporter small permease [Ruegeria pomeroyi]|uniref:TRAP transporter small permease protein n=1 Tax=Ruegeria pomeroyi TaxID=89184 RepID=A0A9Q3WL52_9RHOB|nr:TRAP transporter small permease [Ruegeria pomeroyi]MCE8520840.1 TRAP transporter small permease [Ruegeria pomeroyi]MCE8537924.1 TRAP transporter small permease [Ruegeria pomeroyi]